MLVFAITGKIKPYVRMTQNSKWTDEQAQEYLASKAAIGWQLTQQMAAQGARILGREPIEARISFTIAGGMHRADLDNLVKAVLDAAQGIVMEDDRWVDMIEAKRETGKEHRAVLEIASLNGEGANRHRETSGVGIHRSLGGQRYPDYRGIVLG